MAERDAQIEAVAIGAKGTVLAVQAVGDIGMIGLVKEGKAAKTAIARVPPASAQTQALIEAAGTRVNDPDDDLVEAEINAVTDQWDPAAVTALADSLLARSLAVVDTMPPDDAMPVKRWLYGIADAVAAAAKDRGGHDKVSAAETAVLDDLRARLAITAD